MTAAARSMLLLGFVKNTDVCTFVCGAAKLFGNLAESERTIEQQQNIHLKAQNHDYNNNNNNSE